jgi:hypothetical protein
MGAVTSSSNDKQLYQNPRRKSNLGLREERLRERQRRDLVGLLWSRRAKQYLTGCGGRQSEKGFQTFAPLIPLSVSSEGPFGTCLPASSWRERRVRQRRWIRGLRLFKYVDGNLHCWRLSPILDPVCRGFVLGPAKAWTILFGDAVSMISDLPSQDVDSARPAYMIVNRRDASRFDGYQTHSKLVPCHTLDLLAKIDGGKHLFLNASCLGRWCLRGG